MKKKIEHGLGCLKTVEEAKSKLQKDLEELRQCYKEKVTAYDKLEKDKTRLQQELDHKVVDLENQHLSIFNLKEKQKKLDKLLAEEKTISAKYAEERDRAEAEACEKEAKALSLTQALEEAMKQKAELEWLNKQFCMEMEDLMSSKDDMGKSVEEVKTLLEELEDELWTTMDTRLCLEVKLPAIKSKLRWVRQEQSEEKKQRLVPNEKEAELEEDRMQRSMAVAAGKRQDMNLKDLEAQSDWANKNHNEALEELRKLQVQMKDYTRELEGMSSSLEVMLAQAKENQQKRKSMEAEIIQLQEVKANLEKAKQTLEHGQWELAKDVKVLLQEKGDSEHKRQKAEAQLQELQEKFNEGERVRTLLARRVTELQVELDSVTGLLRQSDSKCSQLTKDVSTLQSQLQDTQELLWQQDQQKQGLSTQLQQVEEEKRSLKKQLEQEEEAKHNLENQIAALLAQVSNMKKKMEHGVRCFEIVKEDKSTLEKDLEGLRQRYKEKVTTYDRVEKDRMWLQQELHHQRQRLSDLEKKQIEVDQ
ncbi:myosin-9-like, partial [Phyllostomus hastatus]|uniref:myosin-9-like n=1 Tax=Phyllostomus hastatus TaxID=9423 RepID=UPI001E683631